MPREFSYPILFHPKEEWGGHFDEGRRDYIILRERLTYGWCYKLVQLVKGEGRREVAITKVLDEEHGRDHLYKAYLADLGGPARFTSENEVE